MVPIRGADSDKRVPRAFAPPQEHLTRRRLCRGSWYNIPQLRYATLLGLISLTTTFLTSSMVRWRTIKIAVSWSVACLSLTGWAQDAAAPAPPQKFRQTAIIRFEGPITGMLEQYFYRKLDAAQQAGCDLVVVSIDSPGGELEASLNLAHRLRDTEWARTVAWIPRQALSGAAIAALGCDEIVMRPSAVIGDAGPIFLDEGFMFQHAPEKIRSDLARKIRDLASAGGRPAALAEAMVDDQLVVFRMRNKQTDEIAFMRKFGVRCTDVCQVRRA